MVPPKRSSGSVGDNCLGGISSVDNPFDRRIDPRAGGGGTVYCPELDIYTQGETEEECLENLREAAELHLEEQGSSMPCAR
jgi:hypothetical protein